MKVTCDKTHLDFGEGMQYELIMEHPGHFAIFDAKGNYRMVGKDYFCKNEEEEEK